MDLHDLERIASWSWPDDADQVLLRALEEETTPKEDRRLAVSLAGELVVINDELARALLSILTSPEEDEEIRAAAAISFGAALEEADLNDFEEDEDLPISVPLLHEIQESLEQAANDEQAPKLVRRRALEASVRARLPWQSDAVRTAYSRDDPDWKLTAVFCMRWVAGFEDEILESLASSDPRVHFEAVCAAGNSELSAAWWHVSKLVTAAATSQPLRLAAIEALASIRPKASQKILAELVGSEDPEIRQAAQEALILADSDDLF